ncbi:unnamed protein product, partial [Symbiodinium pilosum]
HGSTVADAIHWPSKKCCASYPATTCDPTAIKMTPCKDAADFLAQKELHSWCDFNGHYP